MRDIRDDLRERNQALELQVSTVQKHFEQQVEHLKQQRDRRVEELRIDLEAVNRALHFEQRRYGRIEQPQQDAVVTDVPLLRAV